MHYDLYQTLKIDPSLSCTAINDLLSQRLQSAYDEGQDINDPEVDMLTTSINILSSAYRRKIYDSRLHDTRDYVDVPELRRIAVLDKDNNNHTNQHK
ncbi:hypothetical protein [Corynebacterium sp. sy039]|uniref:hypothetical protein n=1 Tax=Corynebacterium sp. sy039 TaxID=2599641 RepID=UPI0011B81900|nr:hypothetical protein [Corynebacterium sp. sy039]QDZ42760.1 hypothetical protein FQV43_06015 [Corynebacterium sp. sy039]